MDFTVAIIFEAMHFEFFRLSPTKILSKGGDRDRCIGSSSSSNNNNLYDMQNSKPDRPPAT